LWAKELGIPLEKTNLNGGAIALITDWAEPVPDHGQHGEGGRLAEPSSSNSSSHNLRSSER
jgi:hypothetical protein